MVSGHSQGPSDVSILCSLVASGEQDHKLLTALLEVHSVSRPIVDTKLADASGNRLCIADKSECQPIHPNLNTRTSLPIAKTTEPFGERRRLTQFGHLEDCILYDTVETSIRSEAIEMATAKR
jgi:hypothetical protein